MTRDAVDERARVAQLLRAIRDAAPSLTELLDETSSHWGFEDPVYRFYHQSFKVHALQSAAARIVIALRALAPDRELNEWFSQIIADGTGKRFEMSHNRAWLEVTRPIVEAFFHAGTSSRWRFVTGARSRNRPCRFRVAGPRC